MLTRLKERFDNEPVMVIAFVKALIYCGTAFGLRLTVEQIGALMMVVEVGTALFTRAKVTPNALAQPKDS